MAGLLAVTIDRFRLYERAEYNARHDLLTGLPNQRYLNERLAELRAGIAEDGESALLMIDLDDLKAFNDTLGHEVGDRVLQIVADEIRQACRTDDFVARVGGDEFVVVMEDADVETATSVADRVHERLADAHMQIDGAPTRIRVSIGVAIAPVSGRTFGEAPARRRPGDVRSEVRRWVADARDPHPEPPRCTDYTPARHLIAKGPPTRLGVEDDPGPEGGPDV